MKLRSFLNRAVIGVSSATLPVVVFAQTSTPLEQVAEALDGMQTGAAAIGAAIVALLLVIVGIKVVKRFSNKA